MRRSLIPILLFLSLCLPDAMGQAIVDGEPYPDFLLPRIDNGEPVSVASLRGKPTVLIHFASW